MSKKTEEEKKIGWKKYLAYKRATGHYDDNGRIHKGPSCLCSRCSGRPQDRTVTEMSEEEIDRYNKTFDERAELYDIGCNPYAWWNGEA